MQEPNTQNRVPLIVWEYAFFLFSIFLALSAWFHHDNLQSFIDGLLWWIIRLMALVCICGIVWLLHRSYTMFHGVRMTLYEGKTAHLKTQQLEIKNEQLRQQVEVTKQIPALLKYAMEAGHNVEVSPRLEVKVTNYLSNIHTLGNQVTGQTLVNPTLDFIPEPYKMSDVLQSFQPSRDGILLAKGRELITTATGEYLCHTTFTSATDGGKTNNERMLLIQLAFLQQCIYLCDRNYQPFRVDKKLGTIYDYTPIERQLAIPPITQTKDAVTLLHYLYGIVEDRRTERRKVQTASALVPFDDKYLFFDELPAFSGEDREVMILLGRLLREARQYGVFVIAAAQDLLNKTLDNDNGAVRDNLLTNFYGGGDSTTARLVLNLAKGQMIDESGLGVQGCTYLRAKGAGIERVKARTPLSDNLATLMLLGDMPAHTEAVTPSESERQEEPITEPVQAVVKYLTPYLSGDMRKVYDACMELQRDGKPISSRNVQALTRISKNKANELIHNLATQGLIVRRKADMQIIEQTGQQDREDSRTERAI